MYSMWELLFDTLWYYISFLHLAWLCVKPEEATESISETFSPHRCTLSQCVNRILQALNQTSCIHSFFFIIATSEALNSQINHRHTTGMSTCLHCNEVQPCNLYIKCSLCPFIACRELKASWCFALRESLVFWRGAVALLVAILNPSWQRLDRNGGWGLTKEKPGLQAIFISPNCFNRTCVSTQSNKQQESNGMGSFSFYAFFRRTM